MRNRILLFSVSAAVIAAAGLTVARAGNFPDPPSEHAGGRHGFGCTGRRVLLGNAGHLRAHERRD